MLKFMLFQVTSVFQVTTRNCSGKTQYLIHGKLLEAKKRIFNKAIDTESKYNLVVFSTFAKRATTRRKQDYH